MVRTGWITKRWTNAAILFANQFVGREFLVLSVAPLITSDLVQAFCKGFRKAISERFGHNRLIVVVVLQKLRNQFVTADSGRDREGSDVVRSPGVDRCDEVRQGTEILLPLPFPLLTQRRKATDFVALILRSCFLTPDNNVIAIGVCWPEPEHTFGSQQFLFNDLVEQFPGITE